MGQKQNNRLGKVFTEATRPGDDNKLQFYIVITCTEAGCETEDAKTNRQGINPNVFIEHFRAKGWDIQRDLKRATCPNCLAAKRLKKASVEPEEKSRPTASIRVVSPVASSAHLAEPKKQTASVNTPLSPLPLPHQPSKEVAMKTETAQVLDFPRQTTQAVSEEPETPLQPTVRPPMQYIEKMLAGSEYLKLNFKILREGIGHYVNGASDEAGAEECHLTLEQFTEFRRQQCGELVDYGALKLLVSTLGTDIEALQTTLSGEVTKLQDMLGNNETPDRKLLQDFVAAEQIKVGQMLTKMREDIDRSVATLQKDADGYFEKLLADGDVHLKDLEAKRTATAKVQLEGLTDRIDEVNVLQKRLSDISSSLPA